MLKKLWEYKKFRFVCVGCFNSIVDITILDILIFVGHFPWWAANIVSVSVSITMSYFLNHFVVFRHHKSPNMKNYLKFFVVTGLSSIALQEIIIYFSKPLYTHLVHTVHISPSFETKISLDVAKVTAILIGMVWNFFFYSKLVFANKKSEDEEEVESIAGVV